MNALIVAGEASGDLYGGELASVLLRRTPSLSISGMGGSRMSKAGVRLLYDYRDVAVVGVFEVFDKLAHLRKAYSEIKKWILQNRPDFAILIDFPDFNFQLARFLKKQNIKIFYFISPQVWAWRKKRIYFLRDHVDLMICILPFEKKMYEEVGLKTVYVGHPLVEIVMKELEQQPPYPASPDSLIGIMPGSRDVEMRRHLPLLIETIERMRKLESSRAILLWPPSLDLNLYDVPEWIEVVKSNRYAAMKACDLLLVASGTSTLEAAILNTPLFVVYRVSGVSWQLGKALVRVSYYGLVNWIAQEKVIPEYIQDRMDPVLLASDAVAFLRDESKKRRMKEDLRKIVESLGPPGAVERTADAILNSM